MEQKYDKKFFDEHKDKLYKHLDILYSTKGLTKERLEILNDIYKDLSLYQKLILEELYKKPTEEDVKRVIEFGGKNEYPELVLVRQEGKITKYLGRGKDKWDEAISWARLNSPYRDNFIDLLKAINDYERLCK